jgi:hypothetical protein
MLFRFTEGNLISTFIISILSLSAFSCKTITPVAPPEAFQTVVIKPELSEISIPVEIPVKALEMAVNRSLKGLLYEDLDMEGDNLAAKVWKIDSIKIGANGNILSYKIPLKIWLRNRLRIDAIGLDLGEMKEIEFALNVKFRTRVNIDHTWKIDTHSSFDGIEWIQRPEINIGGMAIPVAPIAERIIKSELTEYASAIDEQAKKYLEIRSEISKAWETLQVPFRISDDPESWLKIAPVSLAITPLKGTKESLSTVIEVKAYTETVLGSRPIVTPSKLPDLLFGSNQNSAFKIAMLAEIPYDRAEEFASKSLCNQVFSFGKNGKKKLIIDSINLYSSRQQMVIELLVHGSVNGKIFLKGTPFYDPATNKLAFKDFDFDLDTKNKLLKSADWLAHSVFVKKMTPLFEFDFTAQLKESRIFIEESLRNKKIADNIYLNGTLNKLSPENIYLTENSLKLVLYADGAMQVKITDF